MGQQFTLKKEARRQAPNIFQQTPVMQSDIFDIAAPGGNEQIGSSQAQISTVRPNFESEVMKYGDSDTFIEDFAEIDIMIDKK